MTFTRVLSVWICSAVSALCAAQPTEVSFTMQEGIELRGTLVLPEAEETPDGGWPAVLLLAGSGPTDRNGDQGAIRTGVLEQLAGALAEAGVASLRYDKRSVPAYGHQFPPLEEMAAFFRLERFVDDASRGLALLRSHAAIDADRVGVVGHSEGAVLALMLANGEDPPAASALLCGPGRPIATILREQIFAQLDAAPEPARTEQKALFDEVMGAIRDDEPVPLPLPNWMQPIVNITTTGILKDYMTTDPLALARGAEGPILVLNAGADIQVSVERDHEPLAEAVASREGACPTRWSSTARATTSRRSRSPATRGSRARSCPGLFRR
jgi:pimeloyl-ACP methyl ester carboxylesterase